VNDSCDRGLRRGHELLEAALGVQSYRLWRNTPLFPREQQDEMQKHVVVDSI